MITYALPHGEQEILERLIRLGMAVLKGPHIGSEAQRSAKTTQSPRKILNAVFYVLKSGCQWRMLPKDYPPWKTVYHYFRRLRIDGICEQ